MSCIQPVVNNSNVALMPVVNREVRSLDFQALLGQLLQEQRSASLHDFIAKATVMRLSMSDFERYMQCLEQASFITPTEKFKQLFLYACSFGTQEQLFRYLMQTKLDAYLFLIDLLAQPEPPQQAVRSLCGTHIAILKRDVSIPMLLLLLELGVSPNSINIDSASALEWAFGTKNSHLIAEVCRHKPHLLLSHTTHPAITSYFNVKPTDILCRLYLLGACPAAHIHELIEYAARCDDVRLLDLLLQVQAPNQYNNGSTPLHIVCTVPHANKVVLHLLQKGARHDMVEVRSDSYPLHLAINSGNLTAAKQLLEAGANIFTENLSKISPLQQLIVSDQPAQRSLAQHPALFTQKWPIESWLPIIKKLPLTADVLQFLEKMVQANSYPDGPSKQALFVELARLRAWTALRLMMAKGFDIHKSFEELPTPLAQLLNAKMTHGLSFLVINAFLDPNTRLADGLPLLFWSFDKGDQELTNALLIKKADPYATTLDRQTALHYAVKKKATVWIKKFLSEMGHSNRVNVLDIHNRPPLYYALSPLQPDIVSELLRAGALPFHLGDRLVDYCYFLESRNYFSHAIGSHQLYKVFCEAQRPNLTLRQFLDEAGQVHPLEVLKIYFLVPTLGTRPRGFVRKEDYLKALLALRDEFPDAPVEYFYRFLMSVHRGHYARKSQEFSIAAIPGAVDIKQLLIQFDGLNWNRPQEPFYCNPKEVKVMGTTADRGTLRSHLRALVETYVPRRIPLAGTPQGGPSLQLFYTNLETVLKHITLMMTSESDLHLRRKAILKLAWSTIKCGTRWEEVALRVYRLLKFKKKNELLWEDAFDEELSNLREILARSIGNHSVHGYRQVVRNIGNEFNISMIEGISNVAEPHELAYLTPEYCRFFFENSYQANLLLPRALEFFNTSIKSNDGALIKWFTNHLPEEFQPEGVDELAAAASAIPLLYSNPNDQKAALQRLFFQRGTFISPAEIPQDLATDALIKRQRAGDYIDTHVYNLDTAEILIGGIIHFLTQRQVLQEHFPGLTVQFLEEYKTHKRKADTQPPAADPSTKIRRQE